MSVRGSLPVRNDERTGRYFDVLGRLYLDLEEADGEGGALVPVSPGESVLVEHRIVLEAVAVTVGVVS